MNIVKSHSLILILTKIAELRRVGTVKCGRVGTLWESWVMVMEHGSWPNSPTSGELGQYVGELCHARLICFIHDYSDKGVHK